MRRFMTLLAVALFGYALLPSAAQAQVIYVQPGRTYVAPIYIAPPVQAYYYPAPSVTYSSSASYSYYPPTVTYSYSASSAPTVVYSAPATVVAPAGVITTRTYYGYGILRPRGYYTESYYTPLP